jgi:exopolysaccharide biosynthesis predicted pyruvyltransferase EpsI
VISDLRLPRRTSGPDLELIAGLQDELTRRVAPLIPRDRRVALIDFPNHGNVGDALIWLGQRRWLRDHDYDVAYVCDQRSYSPHMLRKRIGNGTVLVCGGGNFGDLWPQWQEFRERVVADMLDQRIVQLPQSIHFREEGNARRAAAVFDAHPDLHLLLRDEASLAFARERFAAASALCPDFAFGLGPLARPAEPDLDLLVLSRTDAERTAEALDGGGAARAFVTDWTVEGPQDTGYSKTWERLQHHSWHFGRRLNRPTPQTTLALDGLGVVYEWLARDRARFGKALLSRGRVVLTDRLHGHVLALLLGIPNVVLDTGYGKIARFVEAWTAEPAASRIAQTPEDASRLAQELLSGGDG